MKSSNHIVYETVVGSERTRVVLTASDYQRWLDRITEDEVLMQDIQDVFDGKTPMVDLDEGAAGIFPGRVFPHAQRIAAKLNHVDSRTSAAVVGALFNQALEEIGFDWESIDV